MRLILLILGISIILSGCGTTGQKFKEGFVRWGERQQALQAQRESEQLRQTQLRLMQEQLEYYEDQNMVLPSQRPGGINNPVHVQPSPSPFFQNPIQPIRPAGSY